MRIIDAYTGREIQPGSVVPSPEGSAWKLLQVRDHLFEASALIQYPGQAPRWQELAVRFTHPKYFLERVAFFPS
jgi:hypothetical protein